MSNSTLLDAAPALGVTVTRTSWSWRYHTGTECLELDRTMTRGCSGTLTTIDVPVQEETFATRVPNFTAPGVPKLFPLIVTFVPA